MTMDRLSVARALRAAAALLATSDRWLGEALDSLEPLLSDWVFSGNKQAKLDLLDAYDALSPKAKAAWDADVAAAFRRAHGGDTATMYRRMKNASVARGMGGVSLTTVFPKQGAEVHSFEVHVDDVLAHHAQEETPLASKAYGHEKEVILKRTAKVKPLGSSTL